ncbi:hypothetical protein EDB84DRAFT_1439811 [Lactarius hengduanensis]|nr:hypothetical protein EDB84DRAFT_1439811 [Lactarius hengduanensis]
MTRSQEEQLPRCFSAKVDKYVRQREDNNSDQEPSSHPPKASRVSETAERVKRVNRGQGGAAAQLAAVAAQIRPDLAPRPPKQHKRTETPADVSVNTMAPTKRGQREANITRDDSPLSLAVLKPSLMQGGPSSAFGFAAGEDPTDEMDAQDDVRVDDRVTPHARESEPDIDEASPDEDERQAQQFLRAPSRRSVVRSPEPEDH